jgi:hypothetical protein
MLGAEDHSLKSLRSMVIRWILVINRARGNSNVALAEYGPCGLKGFEGVWDVGRNSGGREACFSWSCVLKMGRDIAGRES